jgi:acyl-CoA hydrolase
VMEWIDEAAYVCAVGWARTRCIAVYAGGVRFYKPLLIGNVVEADARLLYTGRTSMHISVHIRSGDPKTQERDLTTHCLIVFVALDAEGRSTPVTPWRPVSAEDVALEQHARDLMRLRESIVAEPAELASGDRRIISQL